ncbi:MAG: hypothetical protein JNK82_28310 [Myxococcaceae bacterium]|nr:hypothetical protein [Myxococcaceae bacterium]
MRELVVAAVVLSGCASIAISAAKPKQPSTTQSEQSKAANEAFWKALHAGAYADIGEVKEQLQRAYLADPNDAVTTAHLGFLHIWAVSERDRLEIPRASITDDMLLSQRYFAEAVEMTGDPRYLGFLASTELSNGTIHKDERLLRTGYFRMKDAVSAYPQFNLFSSGYTKSGFPHDSERFQIAVEEMWKNWDSCFGAAADRANPDLTPYMKDETTEGEKRVCWNGWIAPHNHEGFALNFGDMLTKAGDVKAARRMYENAKLSRTYEKWPYRDVLESRLAKLDENVTAFRLPMDQQPKEQRIMFRSEFSCSGCHATLE